MKKFVIAMFVTSMLVICFAAFYVNGKQVSPIKNYGNVTAIDTLMRKFTKEELSSASPLIVEGTVIDLGEERWNTEDGLTPEKLTDTDTMYRDVVLQIDQIHKGVTEQNAVNIRLYSHEVKVGNAYRSSSDYNPKFVLGEKVIVFLTEDESPYNKNKSQEFYAMSGLSQGKWSLDGDNETDGDEKYTRDQLVELIHKHKDDVLNE